MNCLSYTEILIKKYVGTHSFSRRNMKQGNSSRKNFDRKPMIKTKKKIGSGQRKKIHLQTSHNISSIITSK